MARAPLPGAKPVSVYDDKARAVAGVRQIHTIPNGVAVLADGYWAAKKGRDSLHIQWDLGAHAGLSSAGISDMLTAGANSASGIVREQGDVQGAAHAGIAVKALYSAPYLAHACMEPMNCTAWVRGDSVEIWAGTQSQSSAQKTAAKVAEISPDKVRINTLLLGGGFGRRSASEFVLDATLLSKASGKPVKLIYGREEDMAAGFFRSASVRRRCAARRAVPSWARTVSIRARSRGSAIIPTTLRTSASPMDGASPDRRSGGGARSDIRRIFSSSKDSSMSWRRPRSRIPINTVAHCWQVSPVASACSPRPPNGPAGASRCRRTRAAALPSRNASAAISPKWPKCRWIAMACRP